MVEYGINNMWHRSRGNTPKQGNESMVCGTLGALAQAPRKSWMDPDGCHSRYCVRRSICKGPGSCTIASPLFHTFRSALKGSFQGQVRSNSSFGDVPKSRFARNFIPREQRRNRFQKSFFCYPAAWPGREKAFFGAWPRGQVTLKNF